MAKIEHIFIPAESIKRQYAVYVLIARHFSNRTMSYAYVGKSGDNWTSASSPMMRLGNHVSFGKVGSQLRNKLSRFASLETFNLDCLYLPLGEYSPTDIAANKQILAVTNDLERHINQRLQKVLHNQHCFLLNLHEGVGHVPAIERNRRQKVEGDLGTRVSELEEKICSLFDPPTMTSRLTQLHHQFTAASTSAACVALR